MAQHLNRGRRDATTELAFGFSANKVLSSPDAVLQVIEKHLEEKEGIR